MNLLSGVEPKSMTPCVAEGGSGVQLKLKWPKATMSVAQLVPIKFLGLLHRYGHTTVPPPTEESDLRDYPFQTVPVVSGLVAQIEKWKNKKLIPGEDNRPTMTINLKSPFKLEPVPIGNTFELHGLQGDVVTKRQHGYWSGVLLLECEGERNTFQKPVGPESYRFIRQCNGGWAITQDTDELMEDVNIEGERMVHQTKRTRPSIQRPTIEANDLLIENESLKSQLEAAQNAHSDAVRQLLQKEKDVMDLKASKLKIRTELANANSALEQVQREAETHARAVQDALGHAYTKAYGDGKALVSMAEHAVSSVEACLNAASTKQGDVVVAKHASNARNHVTEPNNKLAEMHGHISTSATSTVSVNSEVVDDYDDMH